MKLPCVNWLKTFTYHERKTFTTGYIWHPYMFTIRALTKYNAEVTCKLSFPYMSIHYKNNTCAICKCFKFVVPCCGLVSHNSTHILQGYFTDTVAIIWLPQCQWNDTGGYENVSRVTNMNWLYIPNKPSHDKTIYICILCNIVHWLVAFVNTATTGSMALFLGVNHYLGYYINQYPKCWGFLFIGVRSYWLPATRSLHETVFCRDMAVYFMHKCYCWTNWFLCLRL